MSDDFDDDNGVEEEEEEEEVPSYLVDLPEAAKNDNAWKKAMFHLREFCRELDPVHSDELTKGLLQEVFRVHVMRSIDGTCDSAAAYNYFSRFNSDFSSVETLGSGKEGVVVSAVHKIDMCTYAVKKVKYPRREEHPEQIIREAQVMINLCHPNVVRYHTAWIEFELTNAADNMGTSKFAGISVDPYFYLQMEICSKSNILDIARALSIAGRLRQMLGTARGLLYLHSVGIIHRDVKPGNVLIGMDGQPRIVDFGISVKAENSPAVRRDSDEMGTMAVLYAAPEHEDVEQVSYSSDVFSFGIVMTQILGDFRTRLEEGNAVRQLKTERTHATAMDSVPVEVRDLIIRMTEHNPDDRPTMAHVVAVLEQACSM